MVTAKKRSNKDDAIMTILFAKLKDVTDESIVGKKVRIFS